MRYTLDVSSSSLAFTTDHIYMAKCGEKINLSIQPANPNFVPNISKITLENRRPESSYGDEVGNIPEDETEGGFRMTGDAITCSFTVPAKASGQDYDFVNVQIAGEDYYSSHAITTTVAPKAAGGQVTVEGDGVRFFNGLYRAGVETVAIPSRCWAMTTRGGAHSL